MAAPLTPRRAYIISLALLLIGAGLIALFRAGSGERGPAGGLARLPLRIDGWIGREIPVPDRERAFLGTENVILRQYRQGGDAVNLYILECSSNRASFHPPEYCYVGGRTEMAEKGMRTIRYDGKTITAHRFVFLGPRGRSLVYYWYSFGGRFLADYYRQQLHVVASIIFGRPQPALLIRMSVEGTFEMDRGEAAIAAFVREAMPAVTEFLREEQERDQ
ncbi:MAG: exosortase C-terminal domain/associated protein EpsI [PVC group bacterium]